MFFPDRLVEEECFEHLWCFVEVFQIIWAFFLKKSIPNKINRCVITNSQSSQTAKPTSTN
jgi:hypothetical protein